MRKFLPNQNLNNDKLNVMKSNNVNNIKRKFTLLIGLRELSSACNGHCTPAADKDAETAMQRQAAKAAQALYFRHRCARDSLHFHCK